MASPTPKKVSSLTTIKSRLLRPALTSHYVCRFFPSSPSGRKLLGFLKLREGQGFIGADYENSTNQEVIELSCTEASLPGVNYMTNEIIDDFHGVTERYAYRRSYDDRMDFTFYVDRDYRPINFFESWMAFIAGERQKPATEDRNYFYRVEFPDNYTTDELYITKFERDIGTPNEGPSLTYRFINAFPININTIPVSYDSSQLLKCTVSFSFSRYLIEKTSGGNSNSAEPQAPSTAPGVPSPFGGTENLAPNAPTISGPSLPSTTGAGAGFGIDENLAPGVVPGAASLPPQSPINTFQNGSFGINEGLNFQGQPVNKAAGSNALDPTAAQEAANERALINQQGSQEARDLLNGRSVDGVTFNLL